jgi:hypothetical protein
MTHTINIARDFSRYPAGRFAGDGPFSGELFRKKHLAPWIKTGLVIELDGARGYGSSFLEEAFGGLVRDGVASSEIKAKLQILSSKPSLSSEIWDYIEQAETVSENHKLSHEG